MTRNKRIAKAVSWSNDRYWATWDKWMEVIDWEDEEELCSPAESPSDQADRSIVSHTRKPIAKAVSWTDDVYWAAWDKWDEIICWGEEGECSPATPPINQPGRDKGLDMHGLEVFLLNERTVSIKPADDHQDNMKIGAVVVDLCQFELDGVNDKFEIVEIQIGEVKLEETAERGFNSEFELEIMDVEIEVVDSEFQLNALNWEIAGTKVDKLLVEHLNINNLEAGSVKVSTSNGNVVYVNGM
ncbi:uncharacterized protein LOC125745812 [Brienomyrus brachyistius]|uniref:uncharacterized protein LOC125745812 n=1 Tax=Brienomyrus brachyistius TaxID=42636 RepID=UPI0020B2A4BC|nr:uncharacterized protein LOC125745812 [Brienomyrus brachyistius]